MLRQFLSIVRPRRNAVRPYLALLAAAVLVPTYLLIGFLVLLSARGERAQLETNAARTAVEIAKAIDRQTANLKNITNVLATSRFLDLASLPEFHRQASELSRQLGVQIVLRDVVAERQLVNTSVPWGAPLPSGRPQAGLAAQETSRRAREPILTDLFYAALVKRHVVAAEMPISTLGGQNEGDRYLLSVGLNDRRLRESIERVHIEPDHLVTIVDRQRAIVARSEKHDEFVGRRLPPEQFFTGDRNDNADTGTVTGQNLEGMPFQWSFARSKVAGWIVSVGVPMTTLNAPVATAWQRLAWAGALLAASAAVFVYAFGNYLVRRAGELGVDRAPTREEFEILFESAPYGVLVVDRTGRIVLLNKRLAQEFGYGRDELVGQSVDILVPQRSDGAHAHVRAAHMQHPGARAMGEGRELFGLRKDGSEFPIEVGLNAIQTGGGSFVVATVVDITARKRTVELMESARQERERLHVRLIQAGEDERRRLSRELHDETGQCLTAVTLGLKGLEGHVDADGRPRLKQMQMLLTTLGQSLHQVAYQLRPTSLDDLGLYDALANHVSEWSGHTGIEVDLHCRCALDSLTAEQGTALFRTVQEALTNVAKHARGATTVDIVLDRVDGELRLTVEDNGCGFDVDEIESSAGHSMGLAGMRERLALIGGNLEIESVRGRHTTLFARVPLARIEEVA